MKRFEGKNVVITGAAAGIGQATAERIAEEGGSIALIDINAEGLAATKQKVEALGQKAWTYECNVTDGTRVKQVIDQAAEDMGG
ncbi:MAG: SDR family NAD(P)-dependent oxidoreductase, partial [Myxococcota bacterium]